MHEGVHPRLNTCHGLVLRAWGRALPALADAVSDDAERIDVISALESLRAAVAAAQAEVTAAFAASQRAEAKEAEAARLASGGAEKPHRDRVDTVAHSINAQIGLARRISPHQANKAVHLSTTLVGELPHTLAALRKGQLNEWRAMLIARETAILSPEHRGIVDATLCADPGVIAGWGDRRLVREAAKLGYELDADASVNRRLHAETQRTVTLRPAPDQMTLLSALLPLRDGVAVWKALSTTADSSKAAGDERSRGQIMADTLTSHVLNGSLASTSGHGGTSPEGGMAGTDQSSWWAGAPRQAPRPPKVPVRLNLIMTDQALLTGEGVAWLEGEPIPAIDLDQLAGAPVDVRRLFTDSAGRLVAMESDSRCFPAGLADLIRLRDGSCRTPWCDAPIRQIDHVVPPADGGHTSYGNGQGLCVACNNAKAAGGWVSALTIAGEVHWYPQPPLIASLAPPSGRLPRSTRPGGPQARQKRSRKKRSGAGRSRRTRDIGRPTTASAAPRTTLFAADQATGPARSLRGTVEPLFTRTTITTPTGHRYKSKLAPTPGTLRC